MREPKQLIGDQTDQADNENPCENFVGLQVALRLENGVSKTGIRGHQFRHH